MSNRQHILNELSQISPAVASIPFRNVFTVPEGYFEKLPQALLLNTKAEAGPGVFNSNIFTVPDGYFEGLAGNIMDKIKAMDNDAREEITSISPFISGIDKKNMFSVPDGYFDHLAGHITKRISAVTEETMAISETVAVIGNKNVFDIPPGYFDALEDDILEALPKQAKLVQMQPRRSVFRYAAAAVITGLLGISLFFMFDKKDGDGMPDKEIMAKANQILSDNSFEAELDKLSAADIENYLSENGGQDVTAALVANSAVENSSSLPEAEDYIFDEKTLDKYLNKINLNSN
ncbi:MAG: hypothetical protein WAT19_09955 [Ferruginibacter sp.]